MNTASYQKRAGAGRELVRQTLLWQDRSRSTPGENMMARLTVDWKQTALISVFEEAQNLGIDLRKFDRLHEDVQASLKKATVLRVLKVIRDTWDEAVKDTRTKNWFGEVRNGVYVISIGHGFGVSYALDCSEVMYIGRGNVGTRLRSHLHNWIFDMSRSLRDVPFKFYLEEFDDGRSPDAFKDFEHWLLEEFHPNSARSRS